MQYNQIELSKAGLSEVPNGAHPLRMCLIHEEKPITQFAMCKDYFGDVVWSLYTQKEVNIYGFQFNRPKPVYNLDNFGEMRFYFARERGGQSMEPYPITNEQITKVNHYLFKLYSELNIENDTTDIATVPVYDGFNTFVPEVIWKYKPYLFSFWLYWIRVVFDIPDNMQESSIKEIIKYFSKIDGVPAQNLVSPNTVAYAKTILEPKEKILERKILNNPNLNDKVEKYTQFSVYDIHNNHGIIRYNHPL